MGGGIGGGGGGATVGDTCQVYQDRRYIPVQYNESS